MFCVLKIMFISSYTIHGNHISSTYLDTVFSLLDLDINSFGLPGLIPNNLVCVSAHFGMVPG